MMVWGDDSISECPGCGRTMIVGIAALCAACPIDGYFYVDMDKFRGWYSSRQAFERGDPHV